MGREGWDERVTFDNIPAAYVIIFRRPHRSTLGIPIREKRRYDTLLQAAKRRAMLFSSLTLSTSTVGR